MGNDKNYNITKSIVVNPVDDQRLTSDEEKEIANVLLLIEDTVKESKQEK